MTEATDRFTAEQIRKACGGRLVAGCQGAGARAISTDSRTVERGEAFLALVGERHDAHQFVPQALQAGASIIVAQRAESPWRLPPEVALVLVPDTTRALSRLAAWHRGRLKGKVLAVTGSCGKSTVKMMTAAILSRAGRCTAAKKSFNNRIGLPLTLLEARRDSEFVVLEMGANHTRASLPVSARATWKGSALAKGSRKQRPNLSPIWTRTGR